MRAANERRLRSVALLVLIVGWATSLRAQASAPPNDADTPPPRAAAPSDGDVDHERRSTPEREPAVTPALPTPPIRAPVYGPALQPPYPPGPYYPEGWPAAAAPRVTPAEPAASADRVADAHADRVLVLPTAYTHPAGTVYLSSYDVFLLQIGYAVSDRTQLTLTATPPVAENGIYVFDLSLKQALVATGPVRAAAIASMTGLMNLDEGNVVLGRFGGVAQVCFDVHCRSSASVSGTPLLAGPASELLTGAGAIWQVSRRLALLGELELLVPLGREIARYNGVAAGAGVRFTYERWGLDLAFVRPLDVDEPAPLVPLIAGTYRFLP